MKDIADFLRKEQDRASNLPILYKGWLCRLPSVDKVWFTGSLSNKDDAVAVLHLHILFHDMRRMDFHNGTEDELIAQAEEYLQSIKSEELQATTPTQP